MGEASASTEGSSERHLLWMLAFLKMYEVEEAAASRFGVTEKTWRKWVWIMLSATQSIKKKVVSSQCTMPICLTVLGCRHQVARLTLPFVLPLTPAFPFLHCSTLLARQIKLSSRFKTNKNNIWYMLSVDGIDFVIQEPSDFSSSWYSHKLNGLGLRYKIAVSIVGGNICWTNGPFLAGKINDISIFRRGLMKRLGPNEFVEADRGYEGQPDKVRLPFEAQNKDEIHRKGRIMARHESINRILRKFKALSQRWRHPIRGGQHKVAFDAAITITQIAIEIGATKPFKCEAPYRGVHAEY